VVPLSVGGRPGCRPETRCYCRQHQWVVADTTPACCRDLKMLPHEVRAGAAPCRGIPEPLSTGECASASTVFNTAAASASTVFNTAAASASTVLPRVHRLYSTRLAALSRRRIVPGPHTPQCDTQASRGTALLALRPRTASRARHRRRIAPLSSSVNIGRIAPRLAPRLTHRHAGRRPADVGLTQDAAASPHPAPRPQ
jgi:hypothetical protein